MADLRNAGQPTDEKQRRTEARLQSFAVRSEVYEQCRLEAPDGTLLCYCAERKARWYLAHGLASLRSEDPLTARLNFAPRVRAAEIEVPAERANVCVVCGNRRHLSRHHVIPREYMKHLPARYKSHNVHDCLLVCSLCRQVVDRLYYSRRVELARSLGVLGGCHHVSDGLHGEQVVRAALQKCAGDDVGQQCVQGSAGANDASSLEAVQNFMSNWRRYFADELRPLYLPDGWSVDYRHQYDERPQHQNAKQEYKHSTTDDISM